MLRLLVVLAVSSVLAGCESNKPPPPPGACKADPDCADGWVCLAGRCTDPAAGAIITDPSNAVTPDKIKRELEHRTSASEDRAEQALDVE